MTPKELTNVFLKNSISLKEATRITGKDIVYVRQALTGHLREDKLKQFCQLIETHLNSKA